MSGNLERIKAARELCKQAEEFLTAVVAEEFPVGSIIDVSDTHGRPMRATVEWNDHWARPGEVGVLNVKTGKARRFYAPSKTCDATIIELPEGMAEPEPGAVTGDNRVTIVQEKSGEWVLTIMGDGLKLRYQATGKKSLEEAIEDLVDWTKGVIIV